MSETILVIGGTGMLGEPVARRLQADGYRVRVFARRPAQARARFGPEFQVVAGDVEDTLSLEAALQGCDGVHINLAGGSDPDLERRGAANTAQAAARVGVKRITYLSGASVFEENCWYPGTRAKFQAEAAIQESGVPYSIFKATWFMESLPKLVRGNRAFVFGRQPHPIHWVAADDYARMVSRAYAIPEAANKRFFVYGPEAYTMREALTRYCAIVHPHVTVTSMPFWLLWLIARLGRRAELKAALPFFRYYDQVREGGDPSEANALLGAPTTTLEAWSRQRLAQA